MTTSPSSSLVRASVGAYGSLSAIEIFIIARIVELVKIGWSKETIAEAMSVTPEFIERALLLSTSTH